jgi:hypothetical protein
MCPFGIDGFDGEKRKPKGDSREKEIKQNLVTSMNDPVILCPNLTDSPLAPKHPVMLRIYNSIPCSMQSD